MAWWCLLCAVKGDVLDPALYLSPSPPLTTVSNDGPNSWSLPRMQREADIAVIPISQIKTITTPSPCASSTSDGIKTQSATPTTKIISSPLTEILTMTLPQGTSTVSNTEEEEMMDKAETFWPMRTAGPYFGIHVPLTFALTGTYGRYGTGSGGVIGSSYASVSDDGDTGLFKMYGKTALAGSGYGSYSGGTRIYGKGNGASWSGWGNGKWGHYGKG